MLRRFLRGGLLATLLLLLGVQALAAPESPLASMQAEPAPGFVTRITDTTGAVYEKSGVLDQERSGIAAYSAAIASYELYYDGRLLMNVVPSGFSVQDRPAVTGADSGASLGSTGFYKTTFSIDDTREIFLTGLTESTLEQVQTELTASALEDRYFNLTNVDFIDAEKEFTEVAEGETASDANLCWAAATSNMLRFSGWGSAAGFQTEDDLFGAFISAFTDAGGSYTYALDWFFNGNYQPQNWSGWSHLRAPGKSGAYLPDYAADSLYQTYEISAHIDNLRLVFDALERDCAVGISIGNYISWLRSGGHAITLWGYMRDTSASPYSKEAYPAIFISDSDSDKYDGNLRREAPNRLRVMMMDGMFDGFGDDSWELDYPSWFPWRIDSFTVLEPYSEEIEKDTSGTHDKYASLDFSVQDLCVRFSIFDEMDLSIYTIPAGQSIRINGSVVNNSPYVFSGDLTVKTEASITRVRDGVRVWKDSSTTNYFDQCSAYSHTDFSFSSSSLPEGGYELTVRVSADGEQFSFYISNYTTCVPSIKATPAVYAIRESDHARIDLWRGDPVSMAYGKSTKKTSHRVTSWDAELLPGCYTIYGEATYEYGSKTVKLSTLQVNADKPFVSTGTTFRGSKRCAVVLECSAAEGSAEFGIEYHKAGQEQTERVSFSANFDGVKSRQLCLSFKADAGADYSFRTFIVSEDDTTYGAWNDCPAPTAARILTDAPQNGGADASVWEFTAPSDGVYTLTVQGAETGTLYDTTDVLPKAGREGTMLQRGLYLEAGETALFCVQAEASYTVEVTRAQKIGLCSPVRFNAAFTGYERFFSFTAPAAGSYVFHAAGESGWLYKLGENAVWELYRHFSASRPDSGVSLTLEKGQRVYFRIAYTAIGSYSFAVSRPAPEVSVSDEGVNVSYDPEFTGLHLIALYDTDGQLIDVRSVSVRSLEDHISAVLQGTRTGYVRVFQLDEEKHTPRTAAKQAELA